MSNKESAYDKIEQIEKLLALCECDKWDIGWDISEYTTCEYCQRAHDIIQTQKSRDIRRNPEHDDKLFIKRRVNY